MAKEKSKADKIAKPSKTRVVKARGKRKGGRRQAQKREGSILNMRRKINHDDAGNPFPDAKPKE